MSDIRLSNTSSLPDAPGIYMLTNLINGKRYVGLAKSIRTRMATHRYAAKRKPTNSHIYNAIRKYGIDAFSVYVVEMCNVKDMSAKEYEHIQKINPEYNAMLALDGRDFALGASDET
ncbi:MAG: GIY-YIG nuclease family protein, partial [Beijerinckiaceae bacterium]